MSRLRDLGLAVGTLPPGKGNAITDVDGVAVGQVEFGEPPLHSGLTGVLPHPLDVGRRRLFAGRWGLDGGDGMTGLGVAEDFGTLSSPIFLAPAAVAGKVYDELISHGLGRDPGLSTDAGWPPVVVSVDEAAGNRPADLRRSLDEGTVERLLEKAGEKVFEGGVGIGRGLSCCGYRGGVGTASRLLRVGGSTHTVGLLVAASGGAPSNLSIDGYPIGNFLPASTVPSLPGTLVAVVATDAPLIPLQLERLSGRCAIGLARVGILDAATREGLVIAFSTVPAPKGDKEKRVVVAEAELPALYRAGIEAVEEAVLNALLAPGGAGVESSGQLPLNDWVEAVGEHQRARRRE